MKNRFLFYTLMLTLAVSCQSAESPRPHSLEEILTASPTLPVYTINPDSQKGYQSLKEKYYYFDAGTEKRLIIYFTSTDANDAEMRVARLSIYNMNGQLIMPEEAGNRSFPVKWAQGGMVSNCKVLSIGVGKDLIKGEDYRTCLYWFDEQQRQYKLYSSWSEEESAAFADALVIATK